jgi:hypothetical protein
MDAQTALMQEQEREPEIPLKNWEPGSKNEGFA